MPNVDNPHGLRPTMRNFHGGPVETKEMYKPSSSGTAIFRNDAVCVSTGGQIIAGRSTAFCGVSLDYGALSTLTPHKVIVSPAAVFEAQDNNDTDGIAAANIGKNADIEANAGNASTLVSGHEIDESTINTNNTLDVMILGLHESPDNDYGSYCRVEVMFNRHFFNPVRTGV
jgi:hypothetical protein